MLSRIFYHDLFLNLVEVYDEVFLFYHLIFENQQFDHHNLDYF